MPKPAIMDFIARTPPEFYFLVPDTTWVYGMLVSDDVMEFLINEFTVKSLEIVSVSEIRKVMFRPGARIWGSQDLINI
jgi:hypothetical protein